MASASTSLGEAPRARRWLGNFEPHEVEAAELLLNHFLLVDAGRLRAHLLGELDRAVADGAIRLPAVLIPVLSMEDLGKAVPANPVAYVDFIPGARISTTPGSEGLVGNIVRDRVGEGYRPEARWIHPTATLEQLHSDHVRSIVLMTDNVGSGTQVRRYVEAFRRNPRIRSWISLRLTTIHVVSYAASEQFATSNASIAGADLRVVEFAPTVFSAPWSDQQRSNVLRLCKRYGGGNKGLGFGNAGWLYATTDRVPNTVPDVMRKLGAGWSPLFEGRSVPADLARQEFRHAPESPAAIAARHHEARLSRSLENEAPQIALLLLVLAEFLRRRPTVFELAVRLRHRPSAIRDAIRTLQKLTCLSEQREITTVGKRFLLAGKKGRRILTARSSPE